MKSIDGHKLLQFIQEQIDKMPQVVEKGPPDVEKYSYWEKDDNYGGDVCTVCKYPNPDSFKGQYCSCCGRRMTNSESQQQMMCERIIRRKYNDIAKEIRNP